jgi:hypothetical protein
VNNPEALEREKALHDELAELSNQQSQALQKAIFLQFTREQAAEYDARAKRIGEICKLLGDYKSK